MIAGIVGNKIGSLRVIEQWWIEERNEWVTKTTGNEERTMNCEICKVIQKLGLPKSTHELWLCTNKGMPRRRRRVAMVERRTRRLKKLFA